MITRATTAGEPSVLIWSEVIQVDDSTGPDNVVHDRVILTGKAVDPRN